MKVLLFFGTLILPLQSFSQRSDKSINPKGRANSVGVSISFPVGKFSNTHSAGAAIDYKRYVKFLKADTTKYSRSIAFSVKGGSCYHPGKEITTAGYEFKYSSYFNFYTLGSIDYKFTVPVNVNLAAGPLLSIYKRNTSFGIAVNFFSEYNISNSVAVGPGLFFRKFGKTDALWSGTIRASYVF